MPSASVFSRVDASPDMPGIAARISPGGERPAPVDVHGRHVPGRGLGCGARMGAVPLSGPLPVRGAGHGANAATRCDRRRAVRAGPGRRLRGCGSAWGLHRPLARLLAAELAGAPRAFAACEPRLARRADLLDAGAALLRLSRPETPRAVAVARIRGHVASSRASGGGGRRKPRRRPGRPQVTVSTSMTAAEARRARSAWAAWPGWRAAERHTPTTARAL